MSKNKPPNILQDEFGTWKLKNINKNSLEYLLIGSEVGNDDKQTIAENYFKQKIKQ